jgi:hypothetical protein
MVAGLPVIVLARHGANSRENQRSAPQMTLVLSCLTRDFVVQVSDRYITQPQTGELMEDARNKATLWCQILGFAYSGLAEIDGQHTDLWLVDTIRNCHTIDDVLARIAAEATARFAKFGQTSAYPHHAFVGVGWGKWQGKGPPAPFHVTISNALNDEGRWLRRARREFAEVSARLTPGQDSMLCPEIGASLTARERFELQRNLKRSVARGVGPIEIVRLLARVMRSVAARNTTVGPSLLGMVIPRPARVSGAFTVALTAQAAQLSVREGSPTFFNIPAYSDEPVAAFANSVCRGETITGIELSDPR